MMKWIFAALVSLAVIFGAFSGRMAQVSNAAMIECGNAVTLFLSICGMMCLWSGLMRVADKAGITAMLCKVFSPLARLLFKGINPNGKAFKAISMNITANLLGLGNVSTPLGMEAMHELEKEEGTTDTASNNMVMFVVLNTASIQLVPTTIAAMRLKHGSMTPMDIVPSILFASLMSVLSGIIIVLVGGRRAGNRGGD